MAAIANSPEKDLELYEKSLILYTLKSEVFHSVSTSDSTEKCTNHLSVGTFLRDAYEQTLETWPKPLAD